MNHEVHFCTSYLFRFFKNSVDTCLFKLIFPSLWPHLGETGLHANNREAGGEAEEMGIGAGGLGGDLFKKVSR